MIDLRVHAFGDDALGEHDAVALAQLVGRGELSPREVAEAAIARALRVEPRLHAIAVDAFDSPHFAAGRGGGLYGVPTFVKDNTDIAGLPTGHGSEAFRARPAARDGAYARQYLSTGMTLLGKSRLPEFGFSELSWTVAAVLVVTDCRTGMAIGSWVTGVELGFTVRVIIW